MFRIGKEKKAISIQALSATKLIEDTIDVLFTFYSDGVPHEVQPDVKRIVEQESGLSYYVFDLNINGFPEITPDDPDFNNIFFSLEVKDQEGNRYYQNYPYSSFIAPAAITFGSNLADMEIQKVFQEKGNLTTNFIFKPKGERATITLPDGEPAIYLKVEGRIQRKITWKSNVNSPNTPTLVFRDNEQIGMSLNDYFLDSEQVNKSSVNYHVEQTDQFGNVYSSEAQKATLMNEEEMRELREKLLSYTNKFSEYSDSISSLQTQIEKERERKSNDNKLKKQRLDSLTNHYQAEINKVDKVLADLSNSMNRFILVINSRTRKPIPNVKFSFIRWASAGEFDRNSLQFKSRVPVIYKDDEFYESALGTIKTNEFGLVYENDFFPRAESIEISHQDYMSSTLSLRDLILPKVITLTRIKRFKLPAESIDR